MNNNFPLHHYKDNFHLNFHFGQISVKQFRHVSYNIPIIIGKTRDGVLFHSIILKNLV